MASLAAEVRRSRRTLERMGMTPEEELEQLIREQELDDTYFVRHADGEAVSLDVQTPDGRATFGDLIGVSDDGEITVFAGRSSSGRMVRIGHPGSPFEGEKSQHGTIYGYKRLLCRCLPCTIANNRHTNAYRARKRAEKKAGKND